MASNSTGQTVWTIEIPLPRSTSTFYLATTYPDSDLIYLQSAGSGRAIAQGKAYNLIPAVREAIKRAQAVPA